MNKIKFYIIPSILFLLFSAVSFSQDYFPLEVGNHWQYIRSQSYPEGNSYRLHYINVDSDSIIENNKYYKVNELYYNYLIRYSETDKILYYRSSATDKIAIDFNQLEGTIYYSPFYGDVYAQSGVKELFGFERVYGGVWVIPTFDAEILHYADSIGLNYYSNIGSTDYSYKVINAILFDSLGNETHFSDYYKPEFELNPITTINSAHFNLEFKIRHSHTRVVGNPAPWVNGLDFIKEVKMNRFYAKDDSIITLSPRTPWHILNPVNIDFSVSFQVDTILLKNGFKFYYNFIATDKSIIPGISSSPDSGYYECDWGGTTSVKEKNILTEFNLHQNYPNPFNPTTTIKYQIPESGLVVLKVYDVLGNKILTLANEEKLAGEYEVEFDGSNLPSGIYFYKLRVGKFVETKKMILLK